jgi:hypothetical protein
MEARGPTRVSLHELLDLNSRARFSMKLLRFVLSSALLLAAAPLAAQGTYSIHFNAAQFAAQAGQEARVGISLQNTPSLVTGFQFGVRHDASKLSFERLDIAAGLQAALGGAPDERFYAVNAAPAGGAGITVAMILSADQASVALSPGTHHIFDAVYRVAATAMGTAGVNIAGDLGSPAVPVILDLNGTSQAPAGPAGITSATVSVTGGPVPFRRGDANLSGMLEITDALIILDYLFGGGMLPPGQAARDGCRQIFNVDGTVSNGVPGVEDMADIDVTDSVTLLHYLFLRGVPPAPPFPGCGSSPNPADAEIACTSIACS